MIHYRHLVILNKDFPAAKKKVKRGFSTVQKSLGPKKSKSRSRAAKKSLVGPTSSN